jgi:hypothetical protein
MPKNFLSGKSASISLLNLHKSKFEESKFEEEKIESDEKFK